MPWTTIALPGLHTATRMELVWGAQFWLFCLIYFCAQRFCKLLEQPRSQHTSWVCHAWLPAACRTSAEVLTGCLLFFLSLAVCSLFGWACNCLTIGLLDWGLLPSFSIWKQEVWHFFVLMSLHTLGCRVFRPRLDYRSDAEPFCKDPVGHVPQMRVFHWLPASLIDDPQVYLTLTQMICCMKSELHSDRNPKDPKASLLKDAAFSFDRIRRCEHEQTQHSSYRLTLWR